MYGSHNDIIELTRRQHVGTLFNVFDSNIKSGRNHTNFVKSASQIDDNFASTVIVDDFEFTNVTMLHHDFQKSDHNLRKNVKLVKSLKKQLRNWFHVNIECVLAMNRAFDVKQIPGLN